MDITFHSDNRLYCHFAVYNENAYLTDSEALFEIDTNRKIICEILHYDYRNDPNPPSRQVRINGLHSYDEKLYYIYKGDNDLSVMEINPENPQENKKTSIALDGFSEIMQCHSTASGEFLVLKNNGEIGTLPVG